MAYFDGVKVGDKVYCLFNGDGEVVAVFNDGRDFPIHIQFGFSFHCITLDGKYRVEGDQIVFWQKPDITDKGKPKDPLIKGAAYWVWGSITERKFLRIYAFSNRSVNYFNRSVNYFFDDGYVDSVYVSWDNYELFKQPEGAE